MSTSEQYLLINKRRKTLNRKGTQKRLTVWVIVCWFQKEDLEQIQFYVTILNLVSYIGTSQTSNISQMIKLWVMELECQESESQLHHLLSMWPWAFYLLSDPFFPHLQQNISMSLFLELPNSTVTHVKILQRCTAQSKC